MYQKSSLIVDLNKIRTNASRVRDLCGSKGIEVLGVTKGCSALPEVAKAMIEGGLDHLADSRIDNIISLRAAGFHQNMTQLRIPGLSEVKKTVEYANCSLNSELAVIEALSQHAKHLGKKHGVILMIDVGDLREGVMPEDALDTAVKISKLSGIELIGIGTNLGCYGGVLPSAKNLGLLSTIAQEIRNITGLDLPIVSGGGTPSLKMVKSETIPNGITQLRVGEGILLGEDTTYFESVDWLEQDTFRLSAEVVEVKVKPSVPIGNRGCNALGQVPEMPDKGPQRRAILGLGRQDVNPEGLIPLDPRMEVMGLSYDHVLVDITNTSQTISVGDHIQFQLNYKGMNSLSNSRYIEKRFIGER